MPLYNAPERLVIVDIDRTSENDQGTIDQIEVQFNPSEFTRTIQAIYHEHEVLGQSFAPQEYLRTSNQQIQISLDYLVDVSFDEVDQLVTAQNFIESFLYPPQAESFLSNSPSRMLLLWPNSFSLRCRLHTATFKHHLFAQNGGTAGLKIDMTLKEASVRRITKGRVQTQGPFRAGVGADQKG